ncbi:MAG: hypothetical protein CL424_15905 [Acidimicrobiaceae bacterium]|nr:hypothetical protein [Acidimicrobiaceae bacterium]
MAKFSSDLSAVIAQRHGIVTTDQLTADGWRRDDIRRSVSAGGIVRVHVGVYRVATSPDTFESRCVAASAADPSVVITGPAAARLWEFRHVFSVEQPIVLIEHDRSPIRKGVVIRRTNVLDATDWVERPDGIRVASPVRSWFDCARDLDDERFERLTEWVLDHHASVPTIWAMARRMSTRGRPGSARVTRVLSQREPWQKPAGSGLELKVLKSLEARGVTGIVRQHPIRLPNGIVIHPDGALPDIRWAVEIDHVEWHGGRFDAQRDKGRDRQLRRIRWQVDRVTDQEIRERFAATIDELVELIDLRRHSPAA